MEPVSGAPSDVPVDRLPIFLRGYVVRDPVDDPEFERDPSIGPSKEDWTLTFDCETTVDESQALRFGAYQLRKNGILKEAGLFYAENLPADDLDVLKNEALRRGIKLRNVRHFVDWVFFDKIYELGGTAIGFNLPFDISRLAVKHGSARKSMSGGFSFQLSRNTDRPRVRVRHLSQRVSFIKFGAPPKKRTPEGQKKRGLSVAPRRGYFVDVKAMAGALLSESFSLERLSVALKTNLIKEANEDHGEALTPKYVEYCLNDVQATWECYEKLSAMLAGYKLTTVQPHKLYTEASLGKAYLRQMGVRPWKELQPDFPPELIGQIVSTYYGGRAEVHIRRQRTRTLYCDFLSMYPTVCTLMGLWRFVTAKDMSWRDATSETQALINEIEPAALLEKDAWRQLTTLVQLCPNGDVLPVRARYAKSKSSNIGVNHLTSDAPLWYTLADVVASKILSGRTPRIIKALRFDPGDRQTDLAPINIAGKPEFRVDPSSPDEDFYRRVIDLRQTVKARRDGATGDERSRLDAEQLALKILANATSYGIFIEMNVQDLERREVMTAYGASGKGFPVTLKKFEEPGAFFHPLLGTLITGAARLMLSLAERRAMNEGLDWVFCDTDSLAIAKPADMAEPEFIERARRVCAGFANINPYAEPGSILQVEDINFLPGGKGDWMALAELHCYAVSAKRYALFNMTENGQMILRKGSAHGLGHLRPPYLDPDKKRRADRLKDKRVDLWQEDLWTRIVLAHETGDGVVNGLETDRRFCIPAASRYAANTPEMLRWFKDYNKGRSAYEYRVKPFNFLLSFQSLKPEQLASDDFEAHKWWSSRKHLAPAPVAPFNTDPDKAAENTFDRKMRPAKGRDARVPKRWLMSYARTLTRYHLQPEDKFWTGASSVEKVRRFSGVLRRRNVVALTAQHIGKEADRYEEQRHVAHDEGTDILYDLDPTGRDKLIETIKAGRKRFSVRKIMKTANVSDHTLAAAVSGRGLVPDATLVRIAEAIGVLSRHRELHTANEAELLEQAFEWVCTEPGGLAKLARELAIDPSNLKKMLTGKRKFSAVALQSLILLFNH